MQKILLFNEEGYPLIFSLWRSERRETVVGLKYRNGSDVSDSIGLLISILVRYPEIATINLEPDAQVLKLTFILSELVDEDTQQSFSDRIRSSLDVYNYLEGKNPTTTTISFSDHEKLTFLEVRRDVHSLSQDEISLIISLVRDEFEQIMVKEENENLLEEDLLVQEELIGHMLENLRDCTQEKKLIAFREEGRVLVFNK